MKTKSTPPINNILIVGAGVSGLTTAYCLAKEGYSVKIIAKDFAPNITSNVAGALWEWPPAVCGYHSDLISLDRSKDWGMASYRKFYELSKIPEAGVFIKQLFFFFKEKVNGNPFHLNKMNELKDKVNGFRHDASMISEEDINQNIGLVDSYCHDAPMVDTDKYLVWLTDQVDALGVSIQQYEVKDCLMNIENELLDKYDCDFIVNCSGLGSLVLANEYMYPLRGALVRIINNGEQFSVLEKAYCVSFDEKTREQDIVFIVPRGPNLIILGALAEENEWSKSVNLQNYEPIREMFRRCKEFFPALKNAELHPTEPVRVGLRPFRKGNVRLDKEPNHKIIHNYGHGGAGVTFSWGCAEEIVSMINQESRLNNSVLQRSISTIN